MFNSVVKFKRRFKSLTTYIIKSVDRERRDILDVLLSQYVLRKTELRSLQVIVVYPIEQWRWSNFLSANDELSFRRRRSILQLCSSSNVIWDITRKTHNDTVNIDFELELTAANNDNAIVSLRKHSTLKLCSKIFRLQITADKPISLRVILKTISLSGGDQFISITWDYDAVRIIVTDTQITNVTNGIRIHEIWWDKNVDYMWIRKYLWLHHISWSDKNS